MIISQLRIFQLQRPSLQRSRMQRCSLDDGFGNLSSKRAPKRQDQGLVFDLPYVENLGLELK